MKNKNAVALGRRGGKSKSEAKLKAVKENIAKAREKRWPKKEKPL